MPSGSIYGYFTFVEGTIAIPAGPSFNAVVHSAALLSGLCPVFIVYIHPNTLGLCDMGNGGLG